MIKQSVIDNWSAALVNIAVENKKVNEFREQANAIVEVLKGQDDFVKILSARLTSSEDDINKDQIVEDTFGKFGFDQYVINAMKLLANEASFEYARPVFKQVRKELAGIDGIEYGVVWSTKPLDDKTITALSEKISKVLNTKVTLVNKLDDQLIGGVQVVVAKQLFDGSIKGELDDLKFQILENKIK